MPNPKISSDPGYQIQLLETRIRHLTNELQLTRQDYENTMNNYFDLYTNMEEKVVERTRELKKLQDILELKGRELQIMLDSSTQMIFYRDTTSHYLRVNRVFLETFRLTLAQVIGKTHLDIFPDSTDDDLLSDSEILQTKKGLTNHPTLIHTPQSIKQVLISKIPYIDNQGQLIGVIGFIFDLTEIHRMETELKSLQARLVQSEKMEAIAMVIGGVAHDLNNILSGVVGYPDIILSTCRLDETTRRHINSIKHSGQKAAAMVQDLLTLSRRGIINPEVISLNAIVQEYMRSIEIQKLRMVHPQVVIDALLDEQLFCMSGSAIHVSKILMNLVLNAAEAMPDGGFIEISTENRYLDRPVKGYDIVREGDYVVLRVSDNGVGIPATDLQRIFEPFYTKKIMGRSGTGLGMAVVWGAVKDHHGYIEVESTVGVGTVFTVYFPANRHAFLKEAEPVNEIELRGALETILVVDDLEEQRELATQMLKLLNYVPVSVGSGEEAVQYLARHPVDLVILDMIMEPGIDGLETYRRIKQIRPDQKAIIASGYSDTERITESQKLGMTSYLRKPYVLVNLGKVVRAELS